MTSIDIPSALTPDETAELRRLARGGTVLEVGSLLGYSTVALAQVAHRVDSVDPHEGYPADNPRPTLSTFIENLVRHNVRDTVCIHIGYDKQVLPYLRRGMYDLAFLDLTGLYGDTYSCLWRVVPLLRHRAALCVHDCGHPDWPGAMAAVSDFAQNLGTVFRLVDRMAIFEQTWHN